MGIEHFGLIVGGFGPSVMADEGDLLLEELKLFLLRWEGKISERDLYIGQTANLPQAPAF